MNDFVNRMPIIKIEVESMKHTIQHAMHEHFVKIDAMIQAEIERVTNPENIKFEISCIAQKVMKEEVDKAVRHYFSFGEGRQKIDDMIKKIVI